MATDSQILNYLLASVIAEKKHKLPSEILREARQYYDGDSDKDERITRFSLRKELLAAGCDKQRVIDYLAIRKDKKATNTLGAYELLCKEAKLAGLTIPQVVDICSTHGWAGFKAEWLQTNPSLAIAPKKDKDIFQT